MNLKDVFTLENLNNAFRETAKASHWKEAIQRYQANLLINNEELLNEILSGTYRISRTTDFKINERGKTRYINAPSIRDRIVQKVLCQQVLVPQLTKYLIYDNYASIGNRGTSMARKRIQYMLQEHIRKNGNEGYVVQVDIKNFFGSIDHEKLKKMSTLKLNVEEDLLRFIHYIIDTSSDYSYGLNLGAEAPQILSAFYLYPVDNYVKTVLGVKCYGRYADDMIAVVETKAKAWEVLNGIKGILAKLKLEASERKTHITKLSHGFTYMQIKYNIDNGKIVTRLVSSKITRERRRLKKNKALLDKGILTSADVLNNYKSWRESTIKTCNSCNKTIRSMDNLYKELFGNTIKDIHKKETRDELISEIFKESDLESFKFYLPQ